MSHTLTMEQAREYVESYFNGECATRECTINVDGIASVRFTLRDGFQGIFAVWIEQGPNGPYIYGEY